jgi:hypothetical protein
MPVALLFQVGYESRATTFEQRPSSNDLRATTFELLPGGLAAMT